MHFYFFTTYLFEVRKVDNEYEFVNTKLVCDNK